MLDNNVIQFNLFNAVEHIVESMKFLDYLIKNDEDNSRQEAYANVMYNLQISGDKLCDLGEILIGDKIILPDKDQPVDQQIIEYIDKIQEKIKIRKEEHQDGEHN